ncbi:ABC transporter ATP-binding protein [Aminobacter sp. MET-1]|uniref:ABC transporter ATP-binding protein n=1 Tax=Aminobacter sp. MET-1 TaxID=2951085 RepID=UPI00226A3A92|nr:ABC transporter ATP-binding protein [Aminobacter sp. MET-1]MCX8571510.1 ABC transporter ATP-binding protein [Aminobacter sp. MET-1]
MTLQSTDQPLLEISNLNVHFHSKVETTHAVRGLSFSLGRERLGIVGESGSGKSLTGRAILDLVPHPGRVSADQMTFMGQDLLTMDAKQRGALRGAHMSMVMQDPKFSLNPVMTVGRQIAESYRAHRKMSRRQAKEEALHALESVHIREPNRVYDLYPHEVSGGMGQRIMIAMVLAAEPELLIADEPTSALDVTVQMQVLAILDDLVKERGMGLIFISHDLPLVGSFCDRVIVLYNGRVMETLEAKDLANAKHPYTQGLLNCMPDLDHRNETLPVLQRDKAWLV